MYKIRARKQEDKLFRRSILLDSARHLLLNQQSSELPEVKALAQDSGMAKGSFYNYFKSKEDIFFEVFKEEMKDWFYSFSQPYIDQNFVLHHFDRLQKNILIKKLFPYIALNLAQDTSELNRFFHSHIEILSQKLSKDMSRPVAVCKRRFHKTLIMLFGSMAAENVQLLTSETSLNFDEFLKEIWS